jgi:3-hydroxyacyl-[acyl-carrier-protein] dehydratase
MKKKASMPAGCTLHALTVTPENEICAEVSINSESLWFSGHFPDNPILPGIAQLHLVASVIVASTQENLCIKQLSRVKFKKIVEPDDILKISVKLTSATSDRVYTFRITNQTQDVSSGTIVLFVKTAEQTQAR